MTENAKTTPIEEQLRAYPRSDLDAISLFRVDLGIPSSLV